MRLRGWAQLRAARNTSRLSSRERTFFLTAKADSEGVLFSRGCMACWGLFRIIPLLPSRRFTRGSWRHCRFSPHSGAMHMKRLSSRRSVPRGFTLIELLVVIAIIAVLIALLL